MSTAPVNSSIFLSIPKNVLSATRFFKKRCAVALETSRLAVSRRPESRSFGGFRLTRPRSRRLMLLLSTDFRTNLTISCLSDHPIRRFRMFLSVDLEIEKIRAIVEFALSGFSSLKGYVDLARSSDARLPCMVAEIDVIASAIKRLLPKVLKRSTNVFTSDLIHTCDFAKVLLLRRNVAILND